MTDRPVASPRTTPAADTAATVSLEEVQRYAGGREEAMVALNTALSPTAIEALGGVRVIEGPIGTAAGASSHDDTAARTRAPAVRRSARRTVVKRITEQTPLLSPWSASAECVG
jgi:hypothetical protein